MTDGLSSSAPPGAREIGLDICRGFVLPADRPIYDEVGTVDAYTEMMALLSMAAPWAAVFVDRVDSMQAEFKEIDQLKARAVKAEEDLRTSAAELEKVTSQTTALTIERDSLREQLKVDTQLREQLEVAKQRIARRNDQLKSSRKALRKSKKILDATEDRVFQMGYDEAVRKAHASGLDHSVLLESYMSDPVGRVDVEEPVIASSSEDEDLSE